MAPGLVVGNESAGAERAGDGAGEGGAGEDADGGGGAQGAVAARVFERGSAQRCT